MKNLDPNAYEHVKAEHCLASLVGGGVSLRLTAVIDGNVASYKVADAETKVLYEGLSSRDAAIAFNKAAEAAKL